MTRHLHTELARRLERKHLRVSMEELQARYAQFGYHFDRSLDCRATATYMTGPWAGTSYPCLTLYPVQSDNGLSAWNIDARRDEPFQAMQHLRRTLFSVSAGYIAEV